MWSEICFQEKVTGAKGPAEMFILTQNYLFSRRDAESAEFTQRIILFHTEIAEIAEI